MSVLGFNVGSTISLDDMKLAIDFLQNKDIFEKELQEIKENITSRKKMKAEKIRNFKYKDY